jgi:hypothetical protein
MSLISWSSGAPFWSRADYACQVAMFDEADILLNSGKLDVVIVSARVSEREKRRVNSLAQDTPLLFLDGVHSR